MRYYSKTTGSTYLTGIHSKMPADAVQIDDAWYLAVLANPEPDKIRSHDAEGLPILIVPPPFVPTAYDQEQVDGGWVKEGLTAMTDEEVHSHLNPIPTIEQLALSARHERDKALKALDEVVSNPLRFGELLEEQRLEAATYRRLLLDVPQQETFPQSYVMPEVPTWL